MWKLRNFVSSSMRFRRLTALRMQPNSQPKEKPGAMVAHRGPGIVIPLFRRNIDMKVIHRHRLEIYLPLFAWAECRDRVPMRKMQGYRLDSRLNVTPIWNEVKHG